MILKDYKYLNGDHTTRPPCSIPNKFVNCEVLHTKLNPGTEDCLKNWINLEADLVQSQLRQVPDHIGPRSIVSKPYSHANTNQDIAINLDISCCAGLLEESAISGANMHTTSKSVANAAQEKAVKLGTLCADGLLEESAISGANMHTTSKSVANAAQKKAVKLGTSCADGLLEESAISGANMHTTSKSVANAAQEKAVKLGTLCADGLLKESAISGANMHTTSKSVANAAQEKAVKLGTLCADGLLEESAISGANMHTTSKSVANAAQKKAVKLGTLCADGLLEESAISGANVHTTSKSVANAEQEKAVKVGISCPDRLAEECVRSLKNTCKSNLLAVTNENKALSRMPGGNFAIRCVKSSALISADKSVEHAPISFVNHPTSKSTILNPENLKSYSKPSAKVVKVSHIKWHPLKNSSGAVYSCSCCGQKNIDVISVINHVQKECISLPQIDEHKTFEPHTLSSDVLPTEIEARKVTLDHTFGFKSVDAGVVNGKDIDIDVMGASNTESTLAVGLDNTSQGEASPFDPVIVSVSSLLKPAVVDSPKRIFKYIIRNSSLISSSAAAAAAVPAKKLKANVYKCKNCKKVFKSMNNLSKHENLCKYGKFLCLICGRSFSKKGRLTRHIETHGYSPATCTVCGETFRNDMMLKTHSMLHTGEHPHKCSVCGEGFIFTTSLQKHLHKEHDIVERNFKCNQCDKRFTKEGFLTQHQNKDHSGTKPLHLCPTCGKTYKHKSNLTSHMAIHGPRKHACKLCGYKAYSNQLLSAHILRHKNERNHTCDKCGASFYNMNELKRHIFNHHTDEFPEQCTLCNKAFKFPTRLKHHMIFVHRIIPEGKSLLSCEICSQPFLDEYRLKDHMNIHTGDRPYVCEECGRTFRNLKTYTSHKKIHFKSKELKNTFSCDTCNKTFKTNRTLYLHQQNVHIRGVPSSSLVSCDLCERTFPSIWVLNRHRLGAHSVIGPLGEGHAVKPHYECNLCKSVFESSPDLLEHTKTTHANTEEETQSNDETLDKPSECRKRSIVNRDSTRPYGCDECDKNYASRLGLYQHRRLVHRCKAKPVAQTRKQYECNYCFKMYSSYASLYQHRRYSHSPNIKPVACVTCGKTFKLKTTLKTHMQTHLDDSERETFHCNICDRYLKTKWALQVHTQQHMGIKRYSCDVCGRAFARKHERDNHLQKIHGRTLLLPPDVVEEFSGMQY